MNAKFVIVLGLGVFAAQATWAEDEDKPKWRCDKTSGGKTTTIDAKTREECKQQGGKWVKVEEHGHEHGIEGGQHTRMDDHGHKPGEKK